MVDHLERRDVVDCVERRFQGAEEVDEVTLLVGCEGEAVDGGIELAGPMQIEQSNTVDGHVEGRVAEAIGGGDRGAQWTDRDIEPSIVNRTFELGPEEVAEVLAVAHTRQDPVGLADSAARQVDGRRRLVVVVASGQPAGPQDSRRRSVRERRSMDEPLGRTWPGLVEVEDEPV